MTETTKSLIKQNARWDAGEECWELNIPFARRVTVPLNDSFDTVLDEFKKWVNEHDLFYDHLVVIGGQLILGGLRFKS